MKSTLVHRTTAELYDRAFSTARTMGVSTRKSVQNSFNLLASRLAARAGGPFVVPLCRELARYQPEQMRARIETMYADLIVIGNSIKPNETANLVSLMGGAVITIDQDTERHQARVTSLASNLADIVSDLTGRVLDVRNLEIACRLHDFGKIGFPKSLRTKPDPTPEDRRVINAHLYFSYYLSAAIDPLKPASEIIKYNHAYDGYPPKCKIEDMTIESQILSLADCYDAITNPRPYRTEILSSVEAIACLKKRSYSKELLRAIEAYAARFPVVKS